MKPVRSTTSVEKLWPGETFVCLGTGPSLTQQDVNLCRGKARVIAVNDAHTIAPWADVMYAADESYWRKQQGAPTFGGLKYAIEPQRIAWPGVQTLRNTGTHGLELQATGLRTGLNSGFQAIGLAVHLGAASIVLLGYDMGGGHFFDSKPPVSTAKFAGWIKAFRTLVQPLRDLSVRVVNCSRSTSLDAFPRVALEDMFHVEHRRSA